MNLFSLQNERAAAEIKRRRMLLRTGAIFTLWAAAVLPLFLHSGENYVLPLLVCILLTVVCGFYAVTFFTVEYREARARIRLFESMENAREEVCELRFLADEGERTYRGVILHSFLFATESGAERRVYGFDSDPGIAVGETEWMKIRLDVLCGKGDEA